MSRTKLIVFFLLAVAVAASVVTGVLAAADGERAASALWGCGGRCTQ